MQGILCGVIDTAVSPSWGKTTQAIVDEFQKQSDIHAFIDYSIKNKIIKGLHKNITKLQYGNVSHRDWFERFFIERNFAANYKRLTINPDYIMHISGLCYPKSLPNYIPQYNYSDATIFGGIKYNKASYSKSFIKSHIKGTRLYTDKFKSLFTFNEWTKQSLVHDFGIQEDKIYNVGFGANLKPFNGHKNYSNGHILIVLRRGLEHNKGLDLLLKAFKIAYKKNNTLKLSVVGTTYTKQKGVTYYEGYPREKTIELFKDASLYAMPALFEPNGMVYPEALACKTPILGLNRCAFPEFAGYGKYGFIVEPDEERIAETILEAFNNIYKLKTMGEQGQEFIMNRYLWPIVVKKMLNEISKDII